MKEAPEEYIDIYGGIPDPYEDYEMSPVGYGRKREQYLREYKPDYYEELILYGEIDIHLKETDIKANELEDKLMQEYCAKEGVTEELKAKDMMEWVGRYNSIKHRVKEEVLNQLVYV